MFFKKKKEITTDGRHRPDAAASRGSNVFSYHAHRSGRATNVGRTAADPEPVRRTPRPKAWWQRLSSFAIAIAFLMFSGLSLSLRPTPTIVRVGDTTSQVFLRDSSAYQQAAHQVFASSVFNRNKITINTGGISQRLRQQFPELEAVSISLPVMGHQPVVYIQPSMPKLMLATQKGQVFVLDRSGRALINGAQVRNLQQLPVPLVNDQSGIEITVGQVGLPSSSVRFIAEVVGQVTAKNMQPASLTLAAGGDELDMRVGGVPYFVKFNIRGNPQEEAGTFIAVKQQLENQHKTPGEYIDVRVSGRAYYK